MKKTFILLLMVLQGMVNLFSQTCLSDGITFTSQGQIDSFSINYPGCTEVLGDINIQGNTVNEISNLLGLNTITSVGGSLNIWYNDALQDLSGLENVSNIEGTLWLEGNYLLHNLAGLESLNYCGGLYLEYTALESLTGLENVVYLGYLQMTSNTNLLNLNGLESVQKIDGPLRIEYTNLINLEGLNALDTIQGEFWIYENDALQDFGGLESLNFINEDFEVSYNESIINFEGLENLSKISGSLIIENNINLLTLTGLESLEKVYGSSESTDLFIIDGNPLLESIEALMQLDYLPDYFVSISNNSSLQSLHGLESLSSVEMDYFHIKNNDALQDLSGLDSLYEINSSFIGSFSIIGNDGLQSLQGLGSLNYLSDAFLIEGNSNLQSLNGLDGFPIFGASISIKENNSLENLSGFENIVLDNTSSISILDNAILSACGQDNLCNYILNGGTVTISDNALGCANISEVLEDCFPENINFTGQVISDNDLNCVDSDIDGYLNCLINVYNEDYNFITETDSFGFYQIPVFEGEWTANVIPPSDSWIPCFTDTIFEVSALTDSVSIDFFIQPLIDCPENIVFFTQGQIDSFAINYPGCTEIEGSIYIGLGIDANSIDDLSGLSQITEIGGNLDISNTALTNLSGLENLSVVGDGIYLIQNYELEDISALSSLTFVPGDFYISYNFVLSNLLGLQNINWIGGDFKLQNLSALQNLEGLENLALIEGNFDIISNNNLQNLSALSSLTNIGGAFYISMEEGNLLGLQNLISVGGNLHISIYSYFSNFENLTSLTSIGGELSVIGSSIETFDGLENLNSVGEIRIFNNDDLIDITAIQNLNLDGVSLIEMIHNDLLEFCGIPNICNYLMNGGTANINNNSIGCEGVDEVLFNCLLEIDYATLIGNVKADLDLNCEEGNDEIVSNWDINISNEGFSLTVSTDSLGNYWLPVPQGNWTINVSSADDYWTSCFEDSIIAVNDLDDSIETNFLIQPLGDCPSSSIAFTTQSQIDSFAINYPNCTEIEGALSIHEAESGNITSLIGLNQITSIGNVLSIFGNTNLSILLGLELLTNIGQLQIISNSSLQDMSGLNNLLTIEGTVLIGHNENLQSLTGLESLTSTGYMTISQNMALQDISALGAIDTIDGVLEITGNDNLLSISGMEDVTNLEGLYIFSNPQLQAVSGLNELVTIDGPLYISSNENLENISGFGNLTTVGDYISISLSSLQNLSGLDSLISVGSYFRIINNDSLQNLSGLENLTAIEGFIEITGNDFLQSITELESLISMGNGLPVFNNEFTITNNPLLPVCNVDVFCNYLISGGVATISNNAPGCNSFNELLGVCFPENTNLIGRVIADFDQSCDESDGDDIFNWLVNIYNDDYNFSISTDSEGNYWIPVFEGDWYLNVISPYDFWTPCLDDVTVTATATNDTIVTDLFMQPQGDCAFLDWNVIAPPLRICDDNTFVINYCNVGTQVAEDVIVSVNLDNWLTLQNASLPYTIQDDQILFDIGTVDIFECSEISITAFVDCDNVDLGELQCIHVAFATDDLCSPQPELWDESTVTVSGFCENDSIFFELKNIGVGNMSEEAQFRVDIVIDDIVLLQDVDDYQLLAGDTKMLSYEIDDMTILGMRLEVDQTPGHPINEEASVVVPNCEDIVNNIILTLLPSEDGDPFMESFCGPIVGSFDPNIKSATPAGVGENHEIDKDWALDYMIQFQNTGNAEAYIVVLKDTLSENLDLSTIAVRGASHDFTWALNPDRELVFTFDDIYLPDSTSNEPESHGFVQFTISPKSTILPGEMIENRAGIYFDFNDPIITNTVLHTIRKPVVASSEDLQWCEGDVFEGQEIWENITIQIETNFVEYDSIHFVHLEIVEQMETEVLANVEYGAYYENVLIESDTTFTHTYTSQTGCDSLVTYTVSAITSIGETERILNAVNIYPNPTSNQFMVSNHINGEMQEWVLFNNIGQEIWTKTLAANELLPKISLSDFTSGVYLLKVKTESGTAVWKVVKR